MGSVDYIIIAVIVLVIGGAVAYIIRAKKNGAKCIGCPSGGCNCGEKSDKNNSCCCGCASSKEK